MQNEKAKEKKLSKETWEVDLGNLFGEYRALYHNLSRMQPKVDSAYQFMYDYYSMVKYLGDIHENNEKILQDAHFKALIEKNEVKIFRMGCEAYPTFYFSQIT